MSLHADIVRELIDGSTGLLLDERTFPTATRHGGRRDRDQIQHAADRFRHS